MKRSDVNCDMKNTSGPPAVGSSKNYREGGDTLVNKNICNEEVRSKPSGRRISDKNVLKTRGVVLKIATWNVRSLYQAGKYDNLCLEMNDLKIDILGVSETRWTGDGKISENGKVMVYSGGNAHQDGVGILMKENVAKAMLGYWPVSNRVIMIKLRSKPFDMNIIQVYAPTTEHTDEEIEEFYEEIGCALQHVKSGEINILMGDFNAKVGNEAYETTTGKFGLGTRNERGTKLLEFCKSKDLAIINTFFQHHARNLYTWKSPGDIFRNQIDYIMINQRYRNMVKNIKSYPGADIGSDHNPVVMKMKVKLKIKSISKHLEQYDMNMLKEVTYKHMFNVEVTNRYETLMAQQEVQKNDDVETEWDAMQKSMNESVKSVIPKRPRKAKQRWMTPEILNLMEERKALKGQHEKYKEKDKEIRTRCKVEKEQWWKVKCTEIENLDKLHKTRDMHNKIKEVTGSRKRMQVSRCIKNKEGKTLFGEDEIEKRWVEYIEDLFNDERAETTVLENVNDGEDILLEEVESAIAELKMGKAPGIDNISTEMLKALDEYNVKIIHKICNKIYTTGNIPGNLNDSVFVALPKKPKATECSNFRTLSLINHTLKILLRVILKRNRSLIENEVDEFQSGFVKGKGTREGIFNMKTICERYMQMNKSVYVCFIDYEKAFDRVNHEKLIDCLSSIGVRGRDLRFIQNLYWKQKAYIRLENGLSGQVKIKRGVRQGCILSPILFNLYTAIIFRAINSVEGLKIGGMNINNLRYADDTALLAESEQNLQNILNKVNEEGEEYGMSINVMKTKAMVVTKSGNNKCNLYLGRKEIEQVESFVYLGQLITSDGKNEKEILRRISIARCTFLQMSKSLCCRDIKLDTRQRILRCYIWPTLLYGAETWTISKTMIRKITAFEMWSYRKMLKIPWTEKVTNAEVLNRMETTPQLERTIKTRTLKYFGHVMRHQGLQKSLLEGHLEAKRQRGRPRQTWMDNIKNWTGLNYQQAIRQTNDRKLWRAVSVNPMLIG